jgi:hypothetical protein
MSQKGPFLIPHFVLLINFSASVAITELAQVCCGNANITVPFVGSNGDGGGIAEPPSDAGAANGTNPAPFLVDGLWPTGVRPGVGGFPGR